MNKLNFFMTHKMAGAEKEFLKCTCGYEIHYDRTENYSECPNCKAKKVNHINDLFFGKKDFNYLEIIRKNNSNNIYDFSLEFHLIQANVKINFTKKEFNINDIQEFQWLINFNKNSSEMCKCYRITNIDTEEKKEISLDNLSNEIQTRITSTDNFHWITCGDIINGEAFSEAYEYYYLNKINNLISAVKNCKVICEKYEQLIKSEVDIYNYQYIVNLSKTTPIEQLGVTPAIFKRIVKAKPKYYKKIIDIHRQFKEQSLNYLDMFEKHKVFAYDTYNANKIYRLMTVGKISLKKIYKYLYEDAPRKQGLYNPQQTLELLYDSFEMVQSLKLNLEKSPAALVRYHDVLTREYDMVKDAIKNERFVNVIESYKEYEFYSEVTEEEILERQETEKTINKYIKAEKNKNQKYNMILPKSIDDLVREGKEMNHCVGGYVDRVIRRESLILFLREADNPNKSYVTIEVRPTTKKIQQIRCNSNGKLTNPKAIEFIENWCKEHEIEISSYCY